MSLGGLEVPVGPGLRFRLGSAEWLAAFQTAQGPVGSGAREPGACANFALRAAPRSAETTKFRASWDEEGRIALEALPDEAVIDVVFDWADVLGFSGQRVSEAIALGSALTPRVLRRPSEEGLRLVWTRLASYMASDVLVPDFRQFTLDA